MKRLITVLMALVMVVSLVTVLAACDNGSEDTSTTSSTAAPGEVVTNDEGESITAGEDTSTTLPEGESTTLPEGETTETTGANGETAAPTSGTKPTTPGGKFKQPTTTAEIIAFYNSGLKNTSGLQRVRFKKTMQKVWLKAIGIGEINLHEDENAQKLINTTDNSKGPNDLGQLQASYVKSASSKMSGDKVVLNISLNDTKNSDLKTWKAGMGGYGKFLSYAEIDALVQSLAPQLMDGLTATANEMNGKMANGKLTVTMTQAGKIEKVEYSALESGVGTAKAKLAILSVTADADLAMRLEATYQ